MVNCPKCGAAVREEKAFCHNCGAPMDAAMRQRETPMPDFSATIIEPPRGGFAPQPFVPPAITEVQPAGRETVPVQQQQQQQYPPAGVALPSPMPVAPPFGKRKSSRKIGFAFVILLLFLMFAVFVLALLID
jgi:uncharacterized membrane protein